MSVLFYWNYGMPARVYEWTWLFCIIHITNHTKLLQNFLRCSNPVSINCRRCTKSDGVSAECTKSLLHTQLLQLPVVVSPATLVVESTVGHDSISVYFLRLTDYTQFNAESKCVHKWPIKIWCYDIWMHNYGPHSDQSRALAPTFALLLFHNREGYAHPVVSLWERYISAISSSSSIISSSVPWRSSSKAWNSDKLSNGVKAYVW